MSQGTPGDSRPTIKIGREWQADGAGPSDDLEGRVAYSLIHAPATALFLADVELTKLCVAAGKNGWYVMLKGTRGEKKLVAFMSAGTWRDALVWAATALDTNSVGWHLDDWKPKG